MRQRRNRTMYTHPTPATTVPAVGCAACSGIPSELDRADDLRRPARPGLVPNLPVKTMTCGTWGGAAQPPSRGPLSVAPPGSAMKSTPGPGPDLHAAELLTGPRSPESASNHPHDSAKSLISLWAVVTLDSRTHRNAELHSPSSEGFWTRAQALTRLPHPPAAAATAGSSARAPWRS